MLMTYMLIALQVIKRALIYLEPVIHVPNMSQEPVFLNFVYDGVLFQTMK